MIEALESLLQKEKMALRSGDIGKLSSIAKSKEKLLERLARSECDEHALQRIRHRLAHNATLADAAGRGLRNALERLAAIKESTGPITSYAQDGSGQLIGAPSPKCERKA